MNLDKVFVVGAIIGHVDHGKTTTTSALSKAANLYYGGHNRQYNLDEIDNAPEEKSRGITIAVKNIDLYLNNVNASISDCPGHQDYINNMIAGTSNSDFGILLVAATESVGAQTRQHISLASGLGVKKVYVLYNKMDNPEAQELISFVEEEVRELLQEFNMQLAGSSHISAVNALKDEQELAKLKPVLEWIDSLHEDLERGTGEFKLSVTEIYQPKGQGTIITGSVDSGTVKVGDELEIVGMGRKKVDGSLLSIEFYKQKVQQAKAGMDVGLQVKGAKKEALSKGMVAVHRGKSFLVNRIHGVFQMSKDEQEGFDTAETRRKSTARNKPFKVGFEPQIFASSLGVGITAKVAAIEGQEYAEPGKITELTLELKKPAMIFEDDTVFIRESSKDVGFGRVTRIDRV